MTSNTELNHILANILDLTPKGKLHNGIDKCLHQCSQRLDAKIENITCDRLFLSLRL